MVFEGLFSHPNVLYREAINALKEFKQYNKKEEDSIPVEASVPSIDRLTWQPPPQGIIKVNWDATLNMSAGWIGLGVVARDNLGWCLGARSVTRGMQMEPKTAEVMTAICAVEFSKEVGFFEVIFEGDAAQVVADINMVSTNLSNTGYLIESIQQELKWFRAGSFVHVPRVLNSVAHALAREAAHNMVDCIWLEDTPQSISIIFVREQCGP
jgi:ribonuclease HI